MLLDWNDIRYFLAVAEEKSFSSAARKLNVNHSTVSRRIEHMEARLKLTLFIREKGSCELTDAGNIALTSARAMEASAQDMENLLSTTEDQSMSGKITISTADFMISHILIHEFAAFEKKHPDLTLCLTSSYNLQDLGQREADIVVRLTTDPKRHLPKNLFGRRIADVELCAYRAKHTTAKKLSWIAWDQSPYFEKWLSDNRYPALPQRGELDSFLTMIQAIKLGNYAAILPCFLADTDKELKRLENCMPFNGFEVWILTHPDLKSMTRINTTMQFLADAVTKSLGSGSK